MLDESGEGPRQSLGLERLACRSLDAQVETAQKKGQ
jgi:hypothetical protein